MPIKDKAKSKEYIREYMRKRRAKERLTKDVLERLNHTMLEWRQMLNIIDQIAFIVSRSDLTDSEKVNHISKIPISDQLTPYFKELQKKVIA